MREMIIREIVSTRMFVFILALIAGGVLAEFFLLGMRIYFSLEIAKKSISFERKSAGAKTYFLIVGDSTGVGTGATISADSVAGRIAGDFPIVDIINLSRNGAKVINVIEQLTSIKDTQYDIILIQIGGNDILGFTDLDELKENIKKMLDIATAKSRHIIVMSTGNVGLAPALFPPFNWIYTARTRKVRDIFIKAAGAAGAEYIDLFREKGADPFYADAKKYYARDFLHPSSAGYRIWYTELRKQSTMTNTLSQ
jgi:lysophospholipase L1-like esterase